MDLKENQQQQQQKQQWYYKRRIFTFIVLVQQIMIYFEHAAASISSLYYFKETFKLKNPNFYYGLNMASIQIVTIVAVSVCGRIVDQTRDLRRIGFVTITLSAIGSLLYTMTYSKWLPIVGRMLCGSGDGMRTSFTGEIIFFLLYIVKE